MTKNKKLEDVVREMEGNQVAHFWDLYEMFESGVVKTFEEHSLVVLSRKALEKAVESLIEQYKKKLQ